MVRIVIYAVTMVLLASCEEPVRSQVGEPVSEPKSVEAPTWTEVRYTQGIRFFVTQPESAGVFRRIWLGAIHDKPDATGALETGTLFEADCKQSRMQVLQENAQDSSRTPIPLRRRDRDEWYYANPDMVAYTVLEMACGTTPIKGRGFDSLTMAAKAYALEKGS